MNNRFQIASMLVAYRYAKNQTQSDVSKILDVTFQQIQKYEKMNNGISAVSLLTFCNAYQIPFDSFQNGDAYQVLDGADISIIKKEKALNIIEKLYYKKIMEPLIVNNNMDNKKINKLKQLKTKEEKMAYYISQLGENNIN